MIHVTRLGGNALALPGAGPEGSLDAARAIHLRRQLAQAAEHGAALLASLGLPRLVGPDFVPLDPAAIGEAVEAAVAALDAMDGDVDLEDEGEAEPSLGWTAHVFQTPFNIGGTTDVEHDTADAEATALERHGRGFTASGGDDSEDDDADEDSDPPERDDEHGSDDGEDFGHHASQHAPRPLRATDREAVAAMMARAAQVRRAVHV